MSREVFISKTLKGVGASSGITIGPVYVVEHGIISVHKRSVRDDHVDREIQKFCNAIKVATEELDNIKKAISDDEMRKHAFIIDAYMLILQDNSFVNDVTGTIRDKKVNAEWALDMVVSKYLASFEKIEDPYLRERGQDIKHIYDRLVRILVKRKKSGLYHKSFKGRALIVAHDLSPADTIQFNLNRIAGFATDVGGRTSHTSIVARALEIPAVVGLGDIMSLVKNNDTVIIDGDAGVVIINPSKEVQKEYIARQAHLKLQRRDFLRFAKLKSETYDGFKVKIGANIELLAEMDIVERYGATGIGLYRTEYIYLSRKTLPSEIDHYHIYRKLAENKVLKYITIRTLDIGGDKFASSIEVPKEINPAMGLRAIRLCIKEMSLFKSQLLGILMASAYGPLRILIPMVSGVEEVKMAKAVIHECMDELKRKRVHFNADIKIGIMIEVPSTCMIADVLAKEVDFFSIGTNDLIQYTLAIDRINEYVSYLYEPLHPAVLRMIKRTVDVAHANEIEVALCGEMAGEPLYVPILLGLGLDEMSMNPYSIPRAKKVVRGLNHDFCKELLEKVLAGESAKEGEILLRREMSRLFPEDFARYDLN
ncbi:MAG: phosphoenolpyruvate--protein phosphotransferase [Syntrophobacterales bacterium]|jgi:phosphotransferase system enzyme I (PtsI)|nr:phosphoenolpyruvate--protein phosphotransferase [Syntrophobacterales bacterium]